MKNFSLLFDIVMQSLLKDKLLSPKISYTHIQIVFWFNNIYIYVFKLFIFFTKTTNIISKFDNQ